MIVRIDASPLQKRQQIDAMRKTTPLDVSEEDRALLLSWLGSPRLNARIRLRARIVVASAGGQGARALARDLQVSLETVYLWRRRYAEQGIDGLRSLTSPGRRSQIDRRRTDLILRAGRARGSGRRGPSVAAIARAGGVSRATVRRLWDQHGMVGRATHRRANGLPDARATHEIGPCGIVGIYIDPPCRVLARVAPGDRPRAGRPGPVQRAARRSERASAARALLTALEAFGGDPRMSAGPREIGSARLDEVLGRLRKAGGGAVLEVLAGPRFPLATGAAMIEARSGRSATIRVVRARTQGAWLARATDWLLTAADVQDTVLAGVLGHLMDYFAGWRAGSGPFVWTPSQPPQPVRAA